MLIYKTASNFADWVTNLSSPLKTLYKAGPETDPLRLSGKAHAGFLNKYLSCRDEILTAVDDLMTTLNAGTRQNLKIIVTGHSQGAALAQLATADLAGQLTKYYGEDFDNTKENRLTGYFLAAPCAFNADGADFVNRLVGTHNMIRQNTQGDAVPNVAKLLTTARYSSVGTLALQDPHTAVKRGAAAHATAIGTHLQNGDLSTVVSSLNPLPWIKGLVFAAPHMASDNVNYRMNGNAFDPRMVDTSAHALEAAFINGQEHLARKQTQQSWASALTQKTRSFLTGWRKG